MLPSFMQWAKDSLRAILQAKLALECAILFQSHCNTSPCPPAALAKGHKYSRLCHSRQGSFEYSSARTGVDVQHYCFSGRSMVDEYFLPRQPSWANSHLDNEVTYKSCSVSKDQQIIESIFFMAYPSMGSSLLYSMYFLGSLLLPF